MFHTRDALTKKRVVDLKQELSTLGLSSTGNKNALIERLIEHYSDSVDSDHPPQSNPTVAPVTAQPAADTSTPTQTQSKFQTLPPNSINQSQDDHQIMLQRRAARFGLATLSHDILEARARRFGLKPAVDEETLKLKRAKRFGLNLEEEEVEKTRKRMERFGSVSSTTSHPAHAFLSHSLSNGVAAAAVLDPDILQRRAQRFGLSLYTPIPPSLHSTTSISNSRSHRGSNRLKPYHVPPSNTNSGAIISAIIDPNTLKKRAERFGAVSISYDFDQRLKQRAERFGIAAASL
ncbi:hypothetical protein HDU79_010561 [Rhizoclosmatium sp. JEL0117]|nr:hypothetical protein HDU79_010561 [Rhizoclosmatium sp. JEL0117]